MGQAVYHYIFEPWGRGSHLGIFLGSSFALFPTSGYLFFFCWHSVARLFLSCDQASLSRVSMKTPGWGVLWSREQNACPGYLPNPPLGQANLLANESEPGRWAPLNHTKEAGGIILLRLSFPSLKSQPYRPSGPGTSQSCLRNVQLFLFPCFCLFLLETNQNQACFS